jgi:CHASE2 domain-containing sensor protein
LAIASNCAINRFSYRPYLLAALLGLFLYALHALNLFNFHELDAVDLRFRLRGEQPADPRIVIVEIDDGSLSAVGQWPWPRGINAALLSTISNYSPQFIFLDILFTEASPDPLEDAKLAFAVKEAGNVLLPFYFYSKNPFGAFFPIPALQQDSKTTGFVNVESERDGVIRKFQPYLKISDKIYPSAALALALEIKKLSALTVPILPLDRRERMWIRYPGTIRSFQRIAAWEVMAAAGKQDGELEKLFSNRIVFVGHTATATTDLKPTPFSLVEPGVAIHASAFDTLLRGSYLRSVPAWLDFLTLIALLFLTALISQGASPKKNLLMTLGLLTTYFILNVLAFLIWGVIFLLYLPLVGAILIYVLMLFFKYVDIRFQGELLNRELQTAARIQESFLPKSAPANTNVDMAFECRFAKQVGGDLYDWFELGDKQLAVCVGDVSGKGCPAALYMARALNELRREYKDGRLPGELNTVLNSALSKGETSGMFLTLLYAIIDMKKKKIFFSNAGHEPLLYYSAASKKTQIIQLAQGTPLGLFENETYETAEIPYRTGDILVVISDGVKEQRNSKKEQFGMERLESLVKKEAASGVSAAKIITAIFDSLDTYRKGTPPHDDRTILCIRL